MAKKVQTPEDDAAKTKGRLHLLIRYAKDFLSFNKWNTVGLLVIVLLNGLTQGVGFLMLIPLFNLLRTEIVQGGGADHVAGAWLKAVFHWLNIPMTFPWILLVFFFLMTATAILRNRQMVITHMVQRAYVRRLQSRIFKAIINAQWSFVANRRASDLTHILTSDLPVVATGTFFFLQLISNCGFVACYIFWAANISITLTGITLVTAGTLFFLFRSYFPRAFKTGMSMREAKSRIFSVLMEHISGVKIAKSYGVETAEQANFDEIVSRLSMESVRITRQNAEMKLWFQILSYLILCLMLFYAVNVLWIPLVEVGVIILIFSRLLPSLSALQANAQRLAGMLPSFSATETFYSNALAHQEDLVSGPSDDRMELNQGISLENISFRYSADEKGFAVRNLDLRIPALKTTAVCGFSGIGKSTLTDLIAGILLPDAGTIRVDGVTLGNQNLSTWRKSVGYVTQEAFLFHDTIRNNIGWGNPDATDEEIMEVLDQVAAGRFIRELPKGLDTIVKDRGSRFSGGERQRIVLARTLLRNPKLLILDEATTSLDKKNETAVFQSLFRLRGKITLLFITHDPATIRYADQVIDLKAHLD